MGSRSEHEVGDDVPNVPERSDPGPLDPAESEELESRISAIFDSLEHDVRTQGIDESRANSRFDEASHLAKRLPEHLREAANIRIEFDRPYFIGHIRRDRNDAEGALDMYESAAATAAEKRNSIAGRSGTPFDELRRILEHDELSARLSAVELRLNSATGEVAEQLKSEQRVLRARLNDLSPEALYALPESGELVSELLTQTRDFASELDLDRALETARQAGQLMAEMEVKAESEIARLGIDSSALKYLSALSKLNKARQTSLQVQRDAIVGEVRATEISALDAALDLLDQASKDYREGSRTVTAMSGKDAFRTTTVNQLDGERRRLLNLRAALRARATVRQRAKRAAPLVVPLFLSTFLIGAIGLRLGGLVDHLSGRDLLMVLAISLVVAFAGAFGASIGLDALSIVSKWFASSDKKEDQPISSSED